MAFVSQSPIIFSSISFNSLISVFDNDKFVGAVVGVSNNGATDLLSVKTLSKNICLVPFVKAIVTSVDIKAKKIQINNLEGLLSWNLKY